MTETHNATPLNLCFYDVMMTFKGERGEAAFTAVANLFVEAGAVAGQYEPLDDRGVTALNYLILGTPDNKAVMADDDGHLANTTDIKGLLTRIAATAGAKIVYVTKLTEYGQDFEEFSDIEDAGAARDLVFRQARSVALGRVDKEWVRELAAVSYQDVHLMQSNGQPLALVDGGLDVSRLPLMSPKSAFVYVTPLAMLVRIFLPGRTLGETVHEVNFTWFSPTTPLRAFGPQTEVSRQWASTLSRLQSAQGLAQELEQNPETNPPSDAAELWSSSADLAVVESVLTAAGLPGRSVRAVQHEGRAENLPGVTTVRAGSPEVQEFVEEREAEESQSKRVIVEEERSPRIGYLRSAIFLLLAVLSLWVASAFLTGFAQIGLWIIGVIFAGFGIVTAIGAYRSAAPRRSSGSTTR
jgi:hypothetical protein